ncbi:MAG: hypothetical protein P0116_14710 [Candidatus Nitrosocosmicus sp.]|nr:hypothetical protein [Candidatus Nitrosocosmicus sp.]
MGTKKIKTNNNHNNKKILNKSSQKSKLIVVAITIAVVSIGIHMILLLSHHES